MFLSYQCFCGNEFGSYGLASTKGFACDMQCSNDPSEICGGSWANSIYSTNVTDCSGT